MVPQIFQGCIAEEVESVGIIVPAIDAAHPEHAVAGLQERGAQPFHFALPYFDLCVIPEEVASLAQLLHLNHSIILTCAITPVSSHKLVAAMTTMATMMLSRS